jgi:hypothetical protein
MGVQEWQEELGELVQEEVLPEGFVVGQLEEQGHVCVALSLQESNAQDKPKL